MIKEYIFRMDLEMKLSTYCGISSESSQGGVKKMYRGDIDIK